MADRKPLVFLGDNTLGELPAGDTISWSWVSGAPSIVESVTAGNSTITVDNSDPSNPEISMANIPSQRLWGRVAAGTGVASALTAAQVRVLLNVADGATANTGTVTSVDVVTAGPLAAGGGPITGSGVISLVWDFAAPTMVLKGTGFGTPPQFQALVANDIPDLDASKITSGVLAIERGGSASGTYTPTITAVTNVASVGTVNTASWTRVGDIVTVFGSVAIIPTTASANTRFDVSLPIASTLAGSGELVGTVGSNNQAQEAIGQVNQDVTNNRAACYYVPPVTTQRIKTFYFSYRVI